MSIPRSVLFAILSLGFLAGCGGDETEGIDRLEKEARDFYDKGKYREAKASLTLAYAAFERLEVKDKAKGDKTKAMAYLLKAKAIYLKKLGPQHPETKNVQSWIDSLK